MIDEQYAEFLGLLLEKNKTLNLTAIRDPADAYIRHVDDALAVYDLFRFEQGMSLIDVGSGGGLPGIPLKLRDPSIKLTLLDATAKKVEFLRSTCKELGLDGVKCVAARAEEQSRLPGFRDSYDVAVARGVAHLPALCELCLPFVRPGGHFLAMKGEEPTDEIEASLGIMADLGGRLKDRRSYPLGDRMHTLIIIEKIKATPAEYPRSWAKINKTRRPDA